MAAVEQVVSTGLHYRVRAGEVPITSSTSKNETHVKRRITNYDAGDASPINRSSTGRGGGGAAAAAESIYMEKEQEIVGVEAATTRLKGLVETDRWTASLVALWCMLFMALFVNKTELWVVMAGLVGYACLCFLIDVAIPIPLKPSQRTRLSNGLVCSAHCLATGLAAALDAPEVLKLTMACGFLTFDLWDKTWKHLYTSLNARKGITYALQEATILVLSITAICKSIHIKPDLLVGLPALHLFFESIHDLVRLFFLEGSLAMQLAKLGESITLLPARLLPQAAVLVFHLLAVHRGEVDSSTTTWWAKDVMTLLLSMLNLLNIAAIVYPLLKTKRVKGERRNSYMMAAAAAGGYYNKSPSSLWYVHGKAYDLQDFYARHPGGRQALGLGQGRDCTALFESYHPFTDRHRTVLEKYRVTVPEIVLNKYVVKTKGAVEAAAAEVDNKEKEKQQADLQKQQQQQQGGEEELDLFYETLKARVAKVMEGQDVVASTSRKSYYIFILCTVITSYFGFLRGSWLSLVIFSISSWLMGAMGHDGSHFACSHNPFINQLCGYGISLIASPLLWYHQHTFGHHSFTNDFERDPDLHHFVLTRPHVRQPHGPQHYLQAYRLYVFAQYAVVAFGETVWIPIKLMIHRNLHGILNVPDIHQVSGFLTTIIHFVTYCYLIFYLPSHALAGSIKLWAFPTIYVSICGLLFGIFSQINHLNENSIISAKNRRSWAAEQVETSANFATNSKFWFILSNGLNFQIEHHLFPSINHEHLHLIQPTVIQTCREFGVRYTSFETMGAILKETGRYYKSLSAPTEMFVGGAEGR